MKYSLRVALGVFLLTVGMSGSGLLAESKVESPVTTDNPEIPVQVIPAIQAETVPMSETRMPILDAYSQAG